MLSRLPLNVHIMRGMFRGRQLTGRGPWGVDHELAGPGAAHGSIRLALALVRQNVQRLHVLFQPGGLSLSHPQIHTFTPTPFSLELLVSSGLLAAHHELRQCTSLAEATEERNCD